MHNFKELLTEALIDLDVKDINKVFAPFRHYLDSFSDLLAKPVELIDTRDFVELIGDPRIPIQKFDSSILNSKSAQAAHEVNPITIELYKVVDANHYDPLNRRVVLGIPRSLTNLVSVHQASSWAHHHLKSAQADVSELKMKSTIRHELTHWIDDSLHNLHMRRAFTAIHAGKTPNERAQLYKKLLAAGREDVYLAPIEITAAVNQIAEIKRRIGDKKYNSLTWVKFLELLPGLQALNNSKIGVEWRKEIFKRLARENLIGANFLKTIKT